MSACEFQEVECSVGGQALRPPAPGPCQALPTCLLVEGCSLEGASWMELQQWGGGGKEGRDPEGEKRRREGMESHSQQE